MQKASHIFPVQIGDTKRNAYSKSHFYIEHSGRMCGIDRKLIVCLMVLIQISFMLIQSEIYIESHIFLAQCGSICSTGRNMYSKSVISSIE